MSKQVSANYMGYCPELEKQMSIQVNFVEISMLKELAPQYEKMGYFCPNGSLNGCNSNGSKGNDCPIFKSAHL